MKLFIHSIRGLSEVVSMMFLIDIPNIFIPPTYPGLRLVHVCDNHFNILTLLHCYIVTIQIPIFIFEFEIIKIDPVNIRLIG